jgi:hypothetical protein
VSWEPINPIVSRSRLIGARASVLILSALAGVGGSPRPASAMRRPARCSNVFRAVAYTVSR